MENFQVGVSYQNGINLNFIGGVEGYNFILMTASELIYYCNKLKQEKENL